MITNRIKWQEFHRNGQLWIDGEIGIVSNNCKHLYDYLLGFKGYEGIPVVRLGIWTKYYDNGQVAWKLDYQEGLIDNKDKRKPQEFHSYRKDGTIITY